MHSLIFYTSSYKYTSMHSVENCGISCHGMMDYEESIFLWRIDKRDFFFGNEIGVLVGVGASLAFAIHEWKIHM